VAGETTIRAEPGTRNIVLTRIIRAPRDQVYEAWTQPEHVTRWWDPAGKPLAACVIDLRPGGAFLFVNDRPEGGGESFAGIYRELIRPERIVFNSDGVIGTVVFMEDGTQTRLEVSIECKSEADRDQLLKIGIAVGTARTLDNLAGYVGGPVKPETVAHKALALK
jgi:uncharacterized protein YndB with AHSA1/START domain